MTYLELLSCEEKKAVEELQRRMKNELPKNRFEDSVILYKFLKARDFDVDKAEIMIRKNLAWRKHFQVDTILKDFTPRPFFEKFPKFSHLGLDKNGNMVKYIPIGDIVATEILNCVQMNEYMRHWVWHYEEIMFEAAELTKKTGKNVMQITLIMNLEKLTVANTTSKKSIEICVRLMQIMQDNYPESLNAIYIFNAPGYYVFIYSILKAMMSGALIKKIHVYMHNGWKEKLLEKIDADVLPAFLGGNRTDPDGNPLCTTFVTHAGRIPKMYYLPKEERDFKDKSLVKRTTIPSKQKKEIPVHVIETGSRICWEFFIKKNDIGFGIFYKMSEFEFEEILPVERYETSDGVEKGFYKSLSNGEFFAERNIKGYLIGLWSNILFASNGFSRKWKFWCNFYESTTSFTEASLFWFLKNVRELIFTEREDSSN